MCKKYHLIRHFDEVRGRLHFEHACLCICSDVSSRKSLNIFGYSWELRKVNLKLLGEFSFGLCRSRVTSLYDLRVN